MADKSVEHPQRQDPDGANKTVTQRHQPDHPVPQESDTVPKAKAHNEPDTTENRSVVHDVSGVPSYRAFTTEDQPNRSVSSLVLSPDDPNTPVVEDLVERIRKRPGVELLLGRDVRSEEGARALAVEIVEVLRWLRDDNESSGRSSKEK